MSEIFFSFVIPYRRTESIEAIKSQIVHSCRAIGVSFEIFSVCGNQPTFQRNRCIEQAKGRFIYFLDNDSHLPAESILIAYNCLKDNNHISILGGPSLEKADDNVFQRTLGKLFASRLATGGYSARYTSKGFFRASSDKELILCNLIVARSIFEKVGLLNENLYPNEENEFIHRGINFGLGVYHHPAIKVYRSHRENYRNFIRQMFNYGRGRAEQTKICPSSFKKTLLLPIAFPFYLALVGLLLTNNLFSWYNFIPQVNFILAPLVLYLILELIIMMSVRLKGVQWLHFGLVFPISHLAYGIGFIRGIIFPIKKHKPEIYHLNQE